MSSLVSNRIPASFKFIPEPGVLGLSAAGGLMLAFRRWRKSRK